MKWPHKVRPRKNGPVLARIYRPGKAKNSYRVAWRVDGRRMLKSFPRFTGPDGAKQFAGRKVREIARGHPAVVLSSAETREALAVRDALASFRQRTGRTVSTIQAVTDYLEAGGRLAGSPGRCRATRCVTVRKARYKAMWGKNPGRPLRLIPIRKVAGFIVAVQAGERPRPNDFGTRGAHGGEIHSDTIVLRRVGGGLPREILARNRFFSPTQAGLEKTPPIQRFPASSV